jgi:hypothetical protein
MSLLPQRKKSPEELAKLRETLGIPGAAADLPQPSEPTAPPAAPAPASEHVETIVPAIHQAAVLGNDDPLPLQAEPAAPVAGPKPIHSFKRSERSPAAAAAAVATPVAAVSRAAKPVRSLRKSEHLPPAAPHPESPPDSRLPHQRHSDREIEDIRRREVLSMMNAAPNPRLFPAHPAFIIPGYVFPPAAAAGIWFYQFPIAATAGFAVVSLAIAGGILWRRPISRHHAAFIAVLAVFLIVFSALYYFPHLRHAT